MCFSEVISGGWGIGPPVKGLALTSSAHDGQQHKALADIPSRVLGFLLGQAGSYL